MTKSDVNFKRSTGMPLCTLHDNKLRSNRNTHQNFATLFTTSTLTDMNRHGTGTRIRLESNNFRFAGPDVTLIRPRYSLDKHIFR